MFTLLRALLPASQGSAATGDRAFMGSLNIQTFRGVAKARGQVDQPAPSLLARAFAGKLVPQDPTDEPAEKLLERIRQEEPRIARMTRMKKGKENP